MRNLIGMPLQEAIDTVTEKGFKYTVIVNNFCVKQETSLVTNAKADGDEVVLTAGEFIFDLKE